VLEEILQRPREFTRARPRFLTHWVGKRWVALDSGQRIVLDVGTKELGEFVHRDRERAPSTIGEQPIVHLPLAIAGVAGLGEGWGAFFPGSER